MIFPSLCSSCSHSLDDFLVKFKQTLQET
jgi:hypothetical protein